MLLFFSNVNLIFTRSLPKYKKCFPALIWGVLFPDVQRYLYTNLKMLNNGTIRQHLVLSTNVCSVPYEVDKSNLVHVRTRLIYFTINLHPSFAVSRCRQSSSSHSSKYSQVQLYYRLHNALHDFFFSLLI